MPLTAPTLQTVSPHILIAFLEVLKNTCKKTTTWESAQSKDVVCRPTMPLQEHLLHNNTLSFSYDTEVVTSILTIKKKKEKSKYHQDTTKIQAKIQHTPL